MYPNNELKVCWQPEEPLHKRWFSKFRRKLIPTADQNSSINKNLESFRPAIKDFDVQNKTVDFNLSNDNILISEDILISEAPIFDTDSGVTGEDSLKGKSLSSISTRSEESASKSTEEKKNNHEGKTTDSYSTNSTLDLPVRTGKRKPIVSIVKKYIVS